VIKRAAAHKGAAFVKILQNCNVFNDGAFSALTDRETKRYPAPLGTATMIFRSKDAAFVRKGMSPKWRSGLAGERE
jgi:2-oxoglutarate ferredoxin oxidoreductase subunit beta